MKQQKENDTSLITSKEILFKTNISRATLNNYIKMGIIPKPIVGRPSEDLKGVKKIGFFPREVEDRINLVKALKREGHSMEDIARRFRDETSRKTISFQKRTNRVEETRSKSRYLEIGNVKSRIDSSDLSLTVEDISSPAYLINPNFEIEWANREAQEQIFHQDLSSIAELESRNIFKLLFNWEFHDSVKNWQDIIGLHLSYAVSRFERSEIGDLYEGITEGEVRCLEKLYENQAPTEGRGINHSKIDFKWRDDSVSGFEIYTSFFREGLFFVYVPKEKEDRGILDLLSRREKVINELLSLRMPSLVSLCVLVADLQDSVKISAELPPAEYFQLINGLWRSLVGSFDMFHGICGKHAGDGMLYYFIKRPGTNYIMDAITCAVQLRERTKRFSNEWKIRKGWLQDLYLNIGINEGKEFFGAIESSANIEFTALGDSINSTARISDLARYGSILTTKNLINKISPEDLDCVYYGVKRKDKDRDVFIENYFSRVSDVLQDCDLNHSKFNDISTLPITEIIDIVKRKKTSRS